MTSRAGALVIVLCGCNIAVARAQLPALPPYVTIGPKFETFKISVFGDYGGGAGDIAGRHFVGGQVVLDTPRRWYASVGGGALSFSDSRVGTAPAVAATVARQFPYVPRLVLAVAQSGVGYVAFGDTAGGRHHQVDIPIMLGVGVHGAVPMLSGTKLFSNATAKPWIAARAQIRYTSVTQSPAPASGWRVGFGGAVGLSVVLHRGWGVRGAYDRLWIEDVSTGRTRSEGSFGVGLAFVHALS